MRNETAKIMVRRFTHRILESGLLLITIALGIGASAAGISLVLHTQLQAAHMLESPAYREIIVSTRSDAEEMEVPALVKPLADTAILTLSDLAASELAPGISYAYVSNMTRLNVINEASIERESRMMATRPDTGPTSETTSTSAPTATEGITPNSTDQPPENSITPNSTDQPPENSIPKQYSAEELATLSAEENILIAEVEEISGYEVSFQFFDAWQLQAQYGSLFSDSDYTGTQDTIILGNTLAGTLTPEGSTIESLLGKRLLTRQGYKTIIGILENTGTTNDNLYFAPYQESAAAAGGNFRFRSMNTTLRFAVHDPEKLDETALVLSSWFEQQFGSNQITLSNPRVEAEQVIARNTGIGLLILFLAVSGLFIASVNVSHILMSRAIRMKHHVGILMALGASRLSIVRLFAWESFAITCSGAVLGAVLAIPLNASMHSALEISESSLLSILAGVAISALLTFLFGLLPARHYTTIDPAQAMRAIS